MTLISCKCKYTFWTFLLCFVSLNAQTVKVSSFGFEIDASGALQSAMLSENDTLIIDKQQIPWVLKPMRFQNITNKTILIEEGVEIKALEGAFKDKNDALLSFINCKNLKIVGSDTKLCMNKDEYTDGEWRHGISLWNCKNISLKSLQIFNSGGDGIFIDGTVKGSYSENITITRILSSNNKRQGISIISAKNVQVSNSIFQNTIGTLPGAGVDIEPDNNKNRIENIVFNDCVFRNNDHAGILLALHNLDGSSVPVSIKFLNCVVTDNHNKENKYIASEIVFNSHSSNPVKGEVLLENCTVKNSDWGLFYSRKTSDAYKVTFRNCAAKDICKDNSYPAIYLEVPDYHKGSYNLGGYVFENLVLEYDSDVPYFMVRGATLPTLKHVSSIFGNIKLVNPNDVGTKYVKYDQSDNIQVNLEVKHSKN